jgi:MFS family permease
MTLPVYVTYLGEKAEVLGTIFSAMWLLGGFSSLLGGIVTDTVGSRNTLIISCILGMLGIALLSTIVDVTLLVPLVLLIGVASGMYNVAQPSIIGEIIDSEERGRANSLLSAASTFIGIALPVLWGFMIVKRNTSIAFLLAASLLATAIPVLFIGIKSTYVGRTSEAKRQIKDWLKSLVSALKLVLSNMNLSFIVVAMILLSLAFMATDPFIYMFLIRELGLPTTQIGYILSFGEIMFLASAIPGGVLSDKLGRKAAIILGGILLSASTIGFYLSQGFISFGIAFAVARVGAALFLPSQNALIQDSSPIERVGSIFGLSMFTSSIATGLGTPLMAAVYERFGPRAIFLAAFFIVLPIPIGALLIKGRNQVGLARANDGSR